MNLLEITLGWTLLHSLWQGAIVYLMYAAIRRIIPASSSAAYALNVGSLAVVLLTSISTFAYLFLHATTGSDLSTAYLNDFEWTSASVNSLRSTPSALLLPVGSWVNDHIYEIVLAWASGVLFFGLRLMTAWWYFRRLQKSAVRLTGFWEEKLGELVDDLQITRRISLCQSALVKSPFVVGYLKPIILLPIGMLSSLSTEQVEAILLHELAHIKRHDYLVNFIQSVAEVIFFFHPVVWALSAHIRREREQCCDDMVVGLRNPLTYARALHLLEEAQAGNSLLALGATGKKNQLLQRIKRIMETTVKKEQRSGKMLPALLLVFVLLGASWISVQAYLPQQKKSPRSMLVSMGLDTAKKDSVRGKSATYSRRSVILLNEKGEPHEEVTEEFNGEELTPIAEVPGVNFEVAFTPLPDMVPMAELFPDSLLSLAPVFSFRDTFPVARFEWKTGEAENLSRQLSERLLEQLGNLSQENKMNLDQVMKELNENLGGMKERLDKYQKFEMDGQMKKAMEEAQRAEIMQSKILESNLRRLERDGNEHREWAWNRNGNANRYKLEEANKEVFEKRLTDELIKDGYLGKDEKITKIKWTDTAMEVNGKKIKDQDLNKYQKLHKTYVEEEGRFHHPE